MSKQLAERADAIRARFKELEGKPGSGYHDGDRHYVRIDLVEHPANRFVAPQKNGLPPASKHLVAFFDHDEETVTFVGDDAKKALDVVKGVGHAVRRVSTRATCRAPSASS
jgi:hypothetical protein